MTSENVNWDEESKVLDELVARARPSASHESADERLRTLEQELRESELKRRLAEEQRKLAEEQRKNEEHQRRYAELQLAHRSRTMRLDRSR